MYTLTVILGYYSIKIIKIIMFPIHKLNACVTDVAGRISRLSSPKR